MEGLGQLIAFSMVMLVGSYGAGSAPLFMPMSEEKLHMVSVLGAGLLVGVAFAVIIPEGVLTLIKAFTMKSNRHMAMRSNDLTPGKLSAIIDYHFASFFLAQEQPKVNQMRLLAENWPEITTMRKEMQYPLRGLIDCWAFHLSWVLYS